MQPPQQLETVDIGHPDVRQHAIDAAENLLAARNVWALSAWVRTVKPDADSSMPQQMPHRGVVIHDMDRSCSELISASARLSSRCVHNYAYTS